MYCPDIRHIRVLDYSDVNESWNVILNHDERGSITQKGLLRLMPYVFIHTGGEYTRDPIVYLERAITEIVHNLKIDPSSTYYHEQLAYVIDDNFLWSDLVEREL